MALPFQRFGCHTKGKNEKEMSYYKATELIKNTAQGTGLITTVTHGNFQDIDVKRQTLFPLLHVVPVNLVVTSSIVTYTYTLFFCDLPDFNKEDQYKMAAPWWGTDNTIDVLNQMSLAAQMFIDQLTRGVSVDNKFQVAVTNTGTFFTNKVENLLTGVQMDINITMPNSSTTDGIC
tara:strand:- start:149 stop:676 length:528 start_codon:yes stop_codon:yes gene_type:complete